MSGNNVPSVAFGRPNLGKSTATKSAELDAEALEEIRDRQRIAGREALKKKDKIGEAIGAVFCVENKMFPVQFRGNSISVSRYYPEKNAAVDIFESIGGDEKVEIIFKRNVFKRSGIKYAALSYKSELASIIEQLEA